MNILNKSIQEIEKNYWSDLKEYPTGLVERCHSYRKIKIEDLQIHQINTLLIQDIGSEILFPIVLDRIQNNINEEDDYDDSSFIESIEFYSSELFKNNRDLHNKTLDILTKNQGQIENKIGLKRFDRLLNKIENKINE